jgi:hypothetical protein
MKSAVISIIDPNSQVIGDVQPLPVERENAFFITTSWNTNQSPILRIQYLAVAQYSQYQMAFVAINDRQDWSRRKQSRHLKYRNISHRIQEIFFNTIP